MKRLLWVIRKIELLEYSPLLAHVISFLLIFLTEAETFCVIQIMIEESKKILKHKPTSLKWHFTVLEEDHLKYYLIIKRLIICYCKAFTVIFWENKKEKPNWNENTFTFWKNRVRLYEFFPNFKPKLFPGVFKNFGTILLN